jgi:hypothetical protein
MKKFTKLLALSLMFVCMSISNESKAQSILMTGWDTVVNTASVSATYRATGKPTFVAVQNVLTKVSGTVAGKSYLYASLDGITYVAIDSMTATNQTTNAKIWIVANPKAYAYYKVTHTGSGTMSAILAPKIIIREY